MTGKIRVLRILNRLNIGGPTFNASLLSKYLEPEFETRFLSGMIDPAEESSEYIPRELGIRPIYVPHMFREISLKNDFRAYREIVNHIKEFKPHIVHTHASKAGALGRLAAINHRVPVIVHTFHGNVLAGYFGSLKNNIFIGIEKYLAKHSTRLIAISQKQKSELINKYKIAREPKVEVINLGFDLQKFTDDQDRKRSEFRKKYGIADDELAIGIVARFAPIKNLTMFLRVARKILDSTSRKIRFVVVGDGEERKQFEALSSQLLLSLVSSGFQSSNANLILTSWIKEMDFVYAGLDIVTLTSSNEGTPVSLIEAQAANKPIVTTDVGGVSEITIPGQTAFLSPSGDIESFALNLLRLIEDDDLRTAFGKAGREKVYERFHYSRLVTEMSALYKRLLKEKSIL